MDGTLVVGPGVSGWMSDERAVTVGGVQAGRETLRDLLNRASDLHDGASGRRLTDLARAHGFPVTHTTINQIRSGTYSAEPGERTLKAIAWLAQVDLARVYKAAQVPVPGPPLADELPPGSDYLTPRQRAAVITVIRAMLPAEDEGGEPDAEDAGPGVDVAIDESAYPHLAADEPPGFSNVRRGDSRT
jgi:hypothetical protein